MEHNLPDEIKEIQAVNLYNINPVYMHGYVFPYLILYCLWTYIWFFYIGIAEHFEAGLIGFVAIGCLQILTCLFCHWFVSVKCLFTCRKAQDLKSATVAEVIPTPNNGYPDLVPLNHTKSLVSSKDISWFVFQKVRYTYDAEEKKEFMSAKFPIDNTFKQYVDWKGYQSDEDLKIGEEKYGSNDMKMDIPKFAELFVERATAPFFVFQVFCVGLWCLDDYWYYSIFTLMMLVVFECTLVQQQLRNMSEIRKMGNQPYLIQTYRNKKWSLLRSDLLVPGDIVSIGRSKEEQIVPCDLLLVRGPCIVDESMLTGESVPVMKEPVENVDLNEHFCMETGSKLHVLFSGTKIVQHTSPPKGGTIKSPDNGCIAYVLKTGFSTAQGRLLKTILFSVKRVTANNLETFLFILFLLIFAISAASYVWIKGTADPKRNRYKLFLECTLILTSVVPPELPIELALAVNSSLIALSKLYVFCTEPFRIPFAGKVDICCFDKTGTLTRDEMVVEGVAGLGSGGEPTISPVQESPLETQQVLATCHALVQVDRDIIGDPLEKAMLEAVEWSLTKGDAVIPRQGMRTHPLKLFHRFHFSSALQRMSVIVGHTALGSVDTDYMACVKGSPEALRSMFSDPPADYDQVYLEMARRGARVLALGQKKLGKLSHQEMRDLKRDELESCLNFCGFVIISCPLKSDSRSAVKEIMQSSHHVIMITGDNPLTGCHVSKQLKMTRKKHTLILTPPNELDSVWHWQSVDFSVLLPWKPKGGLTELTKEYDLCMTGDGFAFLRSTDLAWLKCVMPAVKVYARVSPKQKEIVVTVLKQLGYTTLMCGDGTNDVGALKHADVGVALLANAPEVALPQPSANSASQTPTIPTPGTVATNGPSGGPRNRNRPGGKGGSAALPGSNHENPQIAQASKRLSNMMAEMEEDERAQVVRLGDASIAAPFTVKLSSVTGVCHIIKQGRCTLVTTLQMFKILALNALILAYSQSVLYLDGVKFSDIQATLQALLLAGCFLFISRSKPLKVLSKRRPLPNIFNAYTVLTVMLQFSVHFAAVYHLTNLAKEVEPTKLDERGFIDIHAEFQPNLLNSVVYLISIGMQVTTFAVNYKGHPFMASLMENKPLLYSLLGAGGSLAMLASGLVPEASDQFKLVELPAEIRSITLQVLALDFVCCLVIDRVLDFLLGKSSMRRVC